MGNPFWPAIDDIEDAKKACKQAAGISFFVAIVTATIVILQMKKVINLFPNIGPSAFVDAGLFLVIGIFLLRYSRIAAVLGLCLYVGEQIFMMLQAGPSLNIMGIIFTLAFIGGVRGTFEYHSMKAHEEKKPDSSVADAPAEEAEKKPFSFPWRAVVLLAVFAGLAFGVYHYRERLFGKGAAKIKMPSFSNLPKLPSLPGGKGTAESLTPESGSGEKVTLQLKNGKSITGQILYEDETYYTLKAGGSQQIVLKEDVITS
jgi:hypothetical protein